ncbi:hypothetical protein PTSG_02948 [Salpingoeca rosetta]|uniref:ORC1/DEAH AAA+ ATPase domain-containing protein n=1 Tax=Salpingoeca rosetta (strain ATCC 50818 / BSB-021) TaxID=946362 RepID=F2U3T4_SALR5|nr:uncharacterized protein PTSG_02948 [Salpingoeca rosetta]EGD82278.1 hypothetical protein PTSG_02948 [Salpingoeca rosetta]|eukprot:XP_004996461.1 hypothetical protein PTSG_02948 [Salpingoeca rosetta]
MMAKHLSSWLAELLESPFRTAVRCELMSKITNSELELELELDDPSVSVHKPQHPDMPLPQTSTELRESVEELLQRVCLDRHKQVVLTPSQRTVLNDIVTHVFDVVSGNKGASNKGAGRLVVGPKGTGKTTLLLLLEKLLNMLLPASVVVFYASAQTHRDLYKLLHKAIKERTGLSMELPEDTSPSDAPGHFARWLKANKIKVVGLIDEYQAVYTFDEDRWWIIAMHVFGQFAARYTFVLTGSSAHLRGLCFDKAPKPPNSAATSRYTTLVLSPILTKHGLRDVVDHLGMLPMARFIRVDGDDNDDTSVQDEALLRFIFMQTAGLMRNITSLIPAMQRMVEDSLTPVLQACCAIDDEALVATAREVCGVVRNAESSLQDKASALLRLIETAEEAGATVERPVYSSDVHQTFDDTFVARHLTKHSRLLHAMAECLVRHAEERRWAALADDPWALVTALPAVDLEAEGFGPSDLYQAAEDGAVVYGMEEHMISFASPALALAILEDRAKRIGGARARCCIADW